MTNVLLLFVLRYLRPQAEIDRSYTTRATSAGRAQRHAEGNARIYMDCGFL